MAKTHLKLVTPTTKKRAAAPLRRPNSKHRSREHLTETVVEKAIEAAKNNRYGVGYGLQRPVGRRTFGLIGAATSLCKQS